MNVAMTESIEDVLILLNRADTSNKPISFKVSHTARSKELVLLKKLKTAFSMAKKLAKLKDTQEEDDDDE